MNKKNLQLFYTDLDRQYCQIKLIFNYNLTH